MSLVIGQVDVEHRAHFRKPPRPPVAFAPLRMEEIMKHVDTTLARKEGRAGNGKHGCRSMPRRSKELPHVSSRTSWSSQWRRVLGKSLFRRGRRIRLQPSGFVRESFTIAVEWQLRLRTGHTVYGDIGTYLKVWSSFAPA